MPGRALAKNGRISRKTARIGSSICNKSRRTAFQSGVISGSSGEARHVRSFNGVMVNGLRIWQRGVRAGCAENLPRVVPANALGHAHIVEAPSGGDRVEVFEAVFDGDGTWWSG